MFKPYLVITKPGIIFGNLVSIMGGFLLASKGDVNVPLFIATLFGVSCVIASGCVFNNYIDRDIDRLMQRTQSRPLVQGKITPNISLIYAGILGVFGFSLLYLKTNLLATLLAAIGFIVYVILYSLYMKRRSIHGTLIGSISGAMPPVIGYCAVTNQFDLAALILLCSFSLWQMPHSYAIAIFRFSDYQIANIPVLPLKKSMVITKKYMCLYILAFAVVSLSLTFAGYVGYYYFTVMLILNAYWLWLALSSRKIADDLRWARKLFIFSIIIITVFSIMISLDYLS